MPFHRGNAAGATAAPPVLDPPQGRLTPTARVRNAAGRRDFAEMKGRAHCSACGESFECNVHCARPPQGRGRNIARPGPRARSGGAGPSCRPVETPHSSPHSPLAAPPVPRRPALSAPVDVFHDWIDRLEEERATGASALPSQSYGVAPQEPAYGEDVFEDVREFRTKSRKRARPAGDATASRNELERAAGDGGDAPDPSPAPAPAPAPAPDAYPALDDADALFGDEGEDDGTLMFDD